MPSLASTKLDQGKYYLPQQHFLFEESDKFVWVLKAENREITSQERFDWTEWSERPCTSAFRKQQTYFQKLEEIIRDLPAVARIWSSWDSDRSRQPFHWSFSLDLPRCTENKRQTLLALSLPGVWEPREMHANNDRNTLWVILREPRALPARSPIYSDPPLVGCPLSRPRKIVLRQRPFGVRCNFCTRLGRDIFPVATYCDLPRSLESAFSNKAVRVAFRPCFVP